MYATEALVNAYTQTDEAFRNELQSLEGGCMATHTTPPSLFLSIGTAVTCLLQYEFGGDRTIYCAHVGKESNEALLMTSRNAFRRLKSCTVQRTEGTTTD